MSWQKSMTQDNIEAVLGGGAGEGLEPGRFERVLQSDRPMIGAAGFASAGGLLPNGRIVIHGGGWPKWRVGQPLPPDAQSKGQLVPEDWVADFVAACGQYSIPLNIALAICDAESSFIPTTVSSAGAKGLMQLMPENVKDYGVKDPYNPHESIQAGVHHFRDMADWVHSHYPAIAVGSDEYWKLALASYNAGPGNVQKHGGVPPFAETRNYVDRILLGNRARAKWYELQLHAAPNATGGSGMPPPFGEVGGLSTQPLSVMPSALVDGGRRTSPLKYSRTPNAYLTKTADILAQYALVKYLGTWGARGIKSDHPRGRALDVGVRNGSPEGNSIALWAQAHAAELGVKYIIWNHRIWSPGRASQGWRQYIHPSLLAGVQRKYGRQAIYPQSVLDTLDKTLQHVDHVHISFK